MTTLMRIVRYCLDDGTRDLLGKEINERVVTATLDSNDDQAILAGIGAYALQRYLPGEILHGLQVFRAAGSHGLILSNLPTRPVPPTPVTGFGAENDLALTNALHFGLIQLLGTVPFAVGYENGGRLIRNVVPNPAARGTASSWGYDSEFFWHTDNPHLPFGGPGSDPRPHVPRYLTFCAMRNDERVPTELTAADDIVALLSEDSRRRLVAARYTVGAPASNDADPVGRRMELTNAPLLELSADGRYWVRFDRGTTHGQDPEAEAALTRLREAAAASPRRECVLEAGDFLIFDNYRVLHRRRAFTPGPTETARWLRRCYVS
jgi:L-asparagine oxygenase